MPEITDDEMDARLQSAGARWREVTPVPTLPADRGDEVEVTPTPHRPRRARTWLAAATGAALVAAAVVIGIAVTRGDNGAPRPAGQSELAGTTWQLADVRPSGGGTLPSAGDLHTDQDAGRVVLTFAATGARIVVDDGCNTGSGPVQIRDSRLVLGDLARTAMACPSTQSLSDVIDRVFVGDVNWTITAGRLVLTKSGVGSLTYIPLPLLRPSTDPAELVGVIWGLTGVERDSGTSASSTGSSSMAAITITFDGKGGVRVGSICGNATARVTLGRGSMAFSGPYHRHVCTGRLTGDDLDAVKAVNEITGSATWSITDGTLTITKVGTKVITKLTFAGRPSTAPSSTAPSSTGAHPSTLLGTTWLLADVTSPTFHQTLDTTKTKLKLTIDGNGVLGVDDGVNFHSPENEKPVPITATTIDVGQLTSTLAGCAPVGAGAQNCTRSSVVAAFFAGTIGWAVHGDHLTLTRGSTTLVYVRA